jgi:predicted enzyme related to lactoylglutathione lyase
VPEVVSKTVAAGGAVVEGPRKMGGGDFALIKDPAGATFAIYSAG